MATSAPRAELAPSTTMASTTAAAAGPDPVRRAGTHRRLILVLLAALAAFRAADDFLVPLLRPDVFTGDLCQHVWWTPRLADAALFPHDFVADFFSHPRLAPFGYKVIYRILVPFVDPQVIAETIPFVLTIAVVALAFAIGRVAGGTFLGGAVAVVLTLFWDPLLYAVHSGLERSFALPLVLLGTLALMTRRHVWIGAAMLLGAMVYPTVVPTLGFFAAVVFVRRWWSERRPPEQWRGTLGLSLAAVVVLLAVYGRPFPPEIGPRVTAAEARAMPEFSPAGRSKLFYGDPVAFYFLSGGAGIGFEPAGFVAVSLLMLASVLAYPGLIRVETWALAVTSFVLYAAAHAFMFALYLPNRYVKYSLPVVVLLWVAALASRLAGVQWQPVERARAWVGRWPWIGTGAVALVVLAYGVGTVQRVTAKLREPPNVAREAAYHFLATLPKDTLIAAHPHDADAVPLRTRRSVLASTETALPLLSGYYRRVAERLAAELVATYAVDFDEVDALYARFGARVFLVNRARYGPGAQDYYAPFGDDLPRRMALGRARGFALLDPPVDRILFRQGDYTVVRLGPVGVR